MTFKNWDDLPLEMRSSEVMEYYNVLKSKRTSLLIKRTFDIVVSLISLLVLLPVFLVIAVGIKLDSKGPVLFKQVRVTRYGKKFKILKFRTMVSDAEEIGSQITMEDDIRITNMGKKLRKVRLDELPQLLNILIGDMTFVGTRPEVVKYVERYTPAMRATLLLPAGVTSKASIEFKDEEKLLAGAENIDDVYVNEILPNKMVYNLNSLEEFSLINELKTMFKTIGAVLKN